MAKKRTKKPGNVIVMPPTESTPALDKTTELSHLEIAGRAFEIFCERGCQHGHDVDDWLQAERELKRSVEMAVA